MSGSTAMEPFAHAATVSDEARARSKAERLNAQRPVGLIRWKSVALEDGRWEVVAVREQDQLGSSQR